MVRMSLTLRSFLLGTCVVGMVGGCTDGAWLDSSGEGLNPGPLAQDGDDLNSDALSQEEVFGALDASLAKLAEVPESEQVAEDTAPFFGEERELFMEAPAVEVELTEEAIAIEAETREGGMPSVLGHLAGRFMNDHPDSTSDSSGGIFRGHWFAAVGPVQGVFRGQYRPLGPDELPDGIRGGGVFHGRYVDNEGKFRGFLRGRYGHGGDGRGLFIGRWLDRHERFVGVLKGHWRDEPEVNGGTLAGRWAAFNVCDEADSLPEVHFEDGDFGGFDASDEPVDIDGMTATDLAVGVNGTFLRVADDGGDAIDDALEVDEPLDPDVVDIGQEPDLRHGEDVFCLDPARPHGFLRGWHTPFPPDGERLGDGWFRGHWRTAEGDIVGVLFGRWEYRDAPDDQPEGNLEEEMVADGDGHNAPPSAQPHGRRHGVFYGKYVSRSGVFRGFVRGVFGEGHHNLGVFRGRYFNAEEEAKGVLRGRWSNAPGQLGGPLFGAWSGVRLHLDDDLPLENEGGLPDALSVEGFDDGRGPAS